jgi:hypothetical protein
MLLSEASEKMAKKGTNRLILLRRFITILRLDDAVNNGINVRNYVWCSAKNWIATRPINEVFP